MTTHAQPPSPTDELAPGNVLDAEARLELYSTMVLCRTYEEAILREYHADKGPGFDIGKGLVPGRDAPVRRPGARRGRRLRAPHHRRRGDRDPPPAPPRDRARHGPATR